MGDMSQIRNIVILTVAGVSAESGIETFRAANDGRGGPWEKHRVEQACGGVARN
jgi:NAD-dependent deacetylase